MSVMSASRISDANLSALHVSDADLSALHVSDADFTANDKLLSTDGLHAVCLAEDDDDGHFGRIPQDVLLEPAEEVDMVSGQSVELVSAPTPLCLLKWSIPPTHYIY